MVGTVLRHEIPRSAEEVDFDRLVWDPVYRAAVRHLIDLIDGQGADQGAPGDTSGPDNGKPGTRS